MSTRRFVAAAAVLTLLFTSGTVSGQGQFIDIYPKTEEDIRVILDTLEQRVTDNTTSSAPPIVMMLHGPQANLFLKQNFSANRSLIDSTAKLTGYGVLDVKICETWMRSNGHERSALFPFIDTVPYGAGELARLREEEGYSPFSVNL